MSQMIHRVRIENFKSLVDVDVELSPVTVLVGKSGTGKSNFVEALRFLRDAISVGDGWQHLQKHVWPTILPATRADEFPKFRLEFSIPGIAEKYVYSLTFSKDGLQAPPLREALTLGSECFFDQAGSAENPQKSPVAHKSKWNVPPRLMPLPDAGRIAIGRLPSISEAVVAYTALTSGIGCYSFRDDVLTGVLEDRQKKVNKEDSQSGLNDSANNYILTMQEIGTNLQDLNIRRRMLSALQRINSSVVSVELDDIRKPKYAVVGHRFQDKTLSLNLAQQSDGFRRFLAHLLSLYQRPPKHTLIFEHPEDGIHPGALALLAEEFKAAPADGRGQVILTTHSPKLLDHFDIDQLRVVEMDGLETRIGRLAEEQQEALREGLLDAGELLTVDPARIHVAAMETANG